MIFESSNAHSATVAVVLTTLYIDPEKTGCGWALLLGMRGQLQAVEVTWLVGNDAWLLIHEYCHYKRS